MVKQERDNRRGGPYRGSRPFIKAVGPMQREAVNKGTVGIQIFNGGSNLLFASKKEQMIAGFKAENTYHLVEYDVNVLPHLIVENEMYLPEPPQDWVQTTMNDMRKKNDAYHDKRKIIMKKKKM